MSEPPLISFVMTTYKHEAFVREAVEAALAQDWPNLEIVISDDCSPDGTWDVIQEVVGAYRGPHRVITHRQAENVGAGANAVWTVKKASADFQVRAHGDDVSLPHRVRRVVETWQATGAALISHDVWESATGSLEGARRFFPKGQSGRIDLKTICSNGWTKEMLGATFSWHRKVYEVFGPFPPALLPQGHDHNVPLRGALLGGMVYLAEPLSIWRRHPGQMTLKTADFQGDHSVRVETMLAYDLTAQLHRRRELRLWMQAQGQNDELNAANGAVLSVTYNQLLEWSQRRDGLEAEGRQLLWARSRADAEGRHE